MTTLLRRTCTSALVAGLLVALSACGGPGAGAPAANTSQPAATAAAGADAAATTAATPTDQPAETTAPEQEPSAAAEPTAADDTREIPELAGSLEQLQSYRMSFSYTLAGKDDQGQPVQGSMEILEEVVRPTRQRHMRWSASGALSGSTDASSAGSFEFFEAEDVTYMYSAASDGAEPSCFSFSSGEQTPPSQPFFEPDDMISDVDRARLVARGETVNGVVADHYSIDESDGLAGTFSALEGDLWIAQQGSYVVKYRATASGKAVGQMVGAGSEGTITWEYNVEQANQLETISLPAECEAQKPSGDIPVPPDAKDQGNFAGTTTFTSSQSPAALAEFYRSELTAQGWKAGESSSFGGLETLSFSKEGRTLSINITPDSSGSGASVLISETKE